LIGQGKVLWVERGTRALVLQFVPAANKDEASYKVRIQGGPHADKAVYALAALVQPLP
jgi:hypothetical protein